VSKNTEKDKTPEPGLAEHSLAGEALTCHLGAGSSTGKELGQPNRPKSAGKGGKEVFPGPHTQPAFLELPGLASSLPATMEAVYPGSQAGPGLEHIPWEGQILSSSDLESPGCLARAVLVWRVGTGHRGLRAVEKAPRR
jgi:hypothetical protein